MRDLKIHGAGAAQSLIATITRAFYGDGRDVDARFGPVGTMADTIRDGVDTDVIVLTGSVMSQLAAEGLVDRASIVPLGGVRLGVAVRPFDPDPDIANSDDLRSTLLSAETIFLPDPVKSTSGNHLMRVLDALGIAAAVQSKLRVFSTGGAAMAALAAERSDRASVGFTQVTEIVDMDGVRLTGFLPGEFDLTTDYVAAVSTASRHSPAAMAFLGFLSGQEASGIRSHAGFVSPQ